MNTIKINDTTVEVDGVTYTREAKQTGRVAKGGVYKFVTINGVVITTSDNRSKEDDYRYLTGNYFHTKEEAVAAEERTKAIGRVTHAINELNDGWAADWSDAFQCKYHLYYDHNDKFFEWGATYSSQEDCILPQMRGKEIASKIIKDHAADLALDLPFTSSK